MQTEMIRIRGRTVFVKHGGERGHQWEACTSDTLPPHIAEEISAEIANGDAASCDDFVASNGLHYRW